MTLDNLEAARVYDLCAGIGVQRKDALGCSTPAVSADAAYLVLNKQADQRHGFVDNHFVTVRFEDSIRGNKGEGVGQGERAGVSTREEAGLRVCGVRSWRARGTSPVRAIHALDQQCSILLYAQGSHFCFATEREVDKESQPTEGRATGNTVEGGGTGQGGSCDDIVRRRGGEGSGDNGASGSQGTVSLSMDVHMGIIEDFRVNAFSRDVVSGCAGGHVHVLSFDPEMAGIPDMKASKYVGCAVSSVRWHPGQPRLATWTTIKGHLQMLDIRGNRLAMNIQADGAMPVHTHEHLSEAVVALGFDKGVVQLFDVRKTSAVLTLQDPVASSVRQIAPLGGRACLRDVGVSGWATFGTGGVSRYSVRANQILGAGPPGASGVNAVTSNTAAVSLDGCWGDTGLDQDAGLFLAPSGSGQHLARTQQAHLCGISHDFHIVTIEKRKRE